MRKNSRAEYSQFDQKNENPRGRDKKSKSSWLIILIEKLENNVKNLKEKFKSLSVIRDCENQRLKKILLNRQIDKKTLKTFVESKIN